ncbi:substrate-binding domain-containing protein [Alicyclobacillus dauci]|uniref:Helix-turn-helix domain-containing protein n=1 Tax=Alicyclobacillus dauci TaxID=1475485 RepID=A0ABY6Z7E2_9BACL|nr:substrate-binding domain-containing protein [Alicyclobacillus dauci]WAH38174.1 helix-turn-helix domain-containing protein [Alicyclobacillus dauci]
MESPNRVRQVRLQHGLSREDLAEHVGVTRQMIGLIETGKVNPSTSISLRLGKVLNSSVEYLFSTDPVETINAKVVTESDVHQEVSQRVVIGSVMGQNIARPLTFVHPMAQFVAAHGIVPSANPSNRVELYRDVHRTDKTLFISGCDLGLGLLANHISHASRHHQGIWFQASNRAAIEELRRGYTHVAAVHTHLSIEEFKQTLDLPFQVHAMHFSIGQLGWIVSRGNPRGFTSAGDLASGQYTIVNRPAGAGARELLDSELKRYGVPAQDIPGYQSVVRGHIDVAYAVFNGLADVGLAHASAAAQYGLDFLPIRPETCMLVFSPESELDESLQVLQESLQSDSFRQDLAAFGPYDVRATGKTIQ